MCTFFFFFTLSPCNTVFISGVDAYQRRPSPISRAVSARNNANIVYNNTRTITQDIGSDVLHPRSLSFGCLSIVRFFTTDVTPPKARHLHLPPPTEHHWQPVWGGSVHRRIFGHVCARRKADWPDYKIYLKSLEIIFYECSREINIHPGRGAKAPRVIVPISATELVGGSGGTCSPLPRLSRTCTYDNIGVNSLINTKKKKKKV